jgi:CDP-diacylglycerol--serine O-phosphatidyltransferase
MSKLPTDRQFLDLSDYGRPMGRQIAYWLRDTRLTPVHVTLGFVLAGLLAVGCILKGYYRAAVLFLLLKSVLDAADGELARVKNTPSYTGRFLDSLSDMGINLLIIWSIWRITEAPPWMAFLAFFGLQLQGTLYNYYYAILRNRRNGDITSRIFETQIPRALKGEEQRNVNLLFSIYRLCYGVFDKLIYTLDRQAASARRWPNWLMTAVSTFGLGFQLLLIGVMLATGLRSYIFPFFIGYSLFILVFIALRRIINLNS